jgi:hypothetical protein
MKYRRDRQSGATKMPRAVDPARGVDTPRNACRGPITARSGPLASAPVAVGEGSAVRAQHPRSAPTLGFGEIERVG